MTGDSSLFDLPPPQVGRYRVQQQIGVGATGPLFRAEDPDTHRLVAIKVLHTQLAPEVNQQVAADLAALIDRLPAHPAIVTVRAAGVENGEPYLVSDLIPGEGLDDALNRYGPGAVVDVLPRVRVLAEALDQAAERGLCHGALHPGEVIISESATSLNGVGIAEILADRGATIPIRRPYTAPEITRGAVPTTASDQFALAAVTFEWIFGEVVTGPVGAALDVPELPDVRASELAKAFTTALASEPSARFGSCSAFVDRLSAAVPEAASTPDDDRFLDVPVAAAANPPMAWDDKEPEDEPELTLAPSFAAGSVFAAEPKAKRTFGLGALAVTLFLGMGVGLAAGYVVTTRFLPTAIVQPSSPTPPVVNPSVAAAKPTEPKSTRAPSPPPPEAKSGTEVAVAAEPKPATPPPSEGKTPAAPRTAPPAASPAALGQLQIRSTPSGATVQLDGVMRGVTPLTLSGVELGTRTVSVSSSGYVGEERRVTLNASQRTRTVDVKLARARTAAATTLPATGSPGAQTPASATGSLLVDSRPPGAAVTVNGVPRGTTPVSIDRLPPGDYTVTMRLDNFRPVSMVVHVSAGERARAAASLTQVNGQEY